MKFLQESFVALICLTIAKLSLAIPPWQLRIGDPTKYRQVSDQDRCNECLIDTLRIKDDPWWCNHEVNGCCFAYFGEHLENVDSTKKQLYRPELDGVRKTNWCCESCMSGVGQHEQGIENPWDCNFECGRCCFSWYGQSKVFPFYGLAKTSTSAAEKPLEEKVDISYLSDFRS